MTHQVPLTLFSNLLTLITAMHTLPPSTASLPPRPHLLHSEPEQKVDPSKQYQLGIMMAAQRVKVNLCKEESKQSSFTHLNQPSTEYKPIPGWTNGSDSWHTEVCPFTKPHDYSLPVDESSDPKCAYRGFVTSSQCQSGVYSMLDIVYQVPQPLSDEPTSLPHNRAVDKPYSKYNLTFTHCSESWTSMYSSSSVLSMAGSLPTTILPSSRRREPRANPSSLMSSYRSPLPTSMSLPPFLTTAARSSKEPASSAMNMWPASRRRTSSASSHVLSRVSFLSNILFTCLLISFSSTHTPVTGHACFFMLFLVLLLDLQSVQWM